MYAYKTHYERKVRVLSVARFELVDFWPISRGSHALTREKERERKREKEREKERKREKEREKERKRERKKV